MLIKRAGSKNENLWDADKEEYDGMAYKPYLQYVERSYNEYLEGKKKEKKLEEKTGRKTDMFSKGVLENVQKEIDAFPRYKNRLKKDLKIKEFKDLLSL